MLDRVSAANPYVTLKQCPATFTKLLEALDPLPTVLHISAHGCPDGIILEGMSTSTSASSSAGSGGGRGVAAGRGGAGDHILATAEHFVQLLGNRSVPLIVLSSCKSKGLGEELLLKGLAHHVICTTGDIADTTAQRFVSQL